MLVEHTVDTLLSCRIPSEDLLEGIYGTVKFPPELTRIQATDLKIGFEIEMIWGGRADDILYAAESSLSKFLLGKGKHKTTRTVVGSARADGNEWVVKPDTSIVPGGLEPTEDEIEMFLNDETGEGFSREEAIEYLMREEWRMDEKSRGVEIASPVFTLQRGVGMLKEVLAWVQKNGSTNDSCGLHISISTADNKKLDVLKLMLMVGEKYLANKYDRFDNGFAGSNISALKNLMQSKLDALKKVFGANSANRTPEQQMELLDEILRNTGVDSKYRAVNIGHYNVYANEDNPVSYIEFRLAGGHGYESKWPEIIESIQRFAGAVRAAANPTVLRKEYLGMVARLLIKGQDNLVPANNGTHGTIIRKFSDLVNKVNRGLSPDTAFSVEMLNRSASQLEMFCRRLLDLSSHDGKLLSDYKIVLSKMLSSSSPVASSNFYWTDEGRRQVELPSVIAVARQLGIPVPEWAKEKDIPETQPA